MRIASSEIMKRMDECCINDLGMPGVVLMENAALKVVKNIDMNSNERFTVLCGKGNNGGDGFAVARHLHVNKKHVEVFLIGPEEGMTPDCKVNYAILKNLGVNVFKTSNVEDANELRESIQNSDVTIDAVFGTGLKRNVEGIYNVAISMMNENSKYILSIDVPSGFNADNGKVMGNCARASRTVTFQMYKKGFLNYNTDKLTGEIVVEDIGIPTEVVERCHDSFFIMDEPMMANSLHVRDKYACKGDYGRVLIVAGSKGFTGAAHIATQGAVKSGAGLVTLACPRDIIHIMCSKLSEAMTVELEDNERMKQVIHRSNAVAIGPGMGNNENTFKLVERMLESAECPVILDADGINVLQGHLNLLKDKKCKVILTPHFGEMSRLTGKSIECIKENRMEIARNFAREHDVIVLLKGYNTIITDGRHAFINPTGNSAMASGGMGDCLTGLVASMIGQGHEPLEATCIAAYVHGYCGEKLSDKMFNVCASSVLEELPFAIKKLQGN